MRLSQTSRVLVKGSVLLEQVCNSARVKTRLIESSDLPKDGLHIFRTRCGLQVSRAATSFTPVLAKYLRLRILTTHLVHHGLRLWGVPLVSAHQSSPGSLLLRHEAVQHPKEAVCSIQRVASSVLHYATAPSRYCQAAGSALSANTWRITFPQLSPAPHSSVPAAMKHSVLAVEGACRHPSFGTSPKAVLRKLLCHF